jgi:type II secretory pathway pseudopilin PulG
MSEYTEKRTTVQDAPACRRIVGSRPIVETQYESVVQERRGMSGVVVAVLVVAGIAAAIVITMLIISSQQAKSDQQLAQERSAAAKQTTAQPGQQQPSVIVVPPSQPAAAPAAVAPPMASALSSADVERDVNSKLLDDRELRSYSVDVKVSGGTATLSGQVPHEDLKMRAEKLAGTVRGIRSIINNITVQS